MMTVFWTATTEQFMLAYHQKEREKGETILRFKAHVSSWHYSAEKYLQEKLVIGNNFLLNLNMRWYIKPVVVKLKFINHLDSIICIYLSLKTVGIVAERVKTSFLLRLWSHDFFAPWSQGCFIISRFSNFLTVTLFSNGIFNAEHEFDIIFLLWSHLGGAPSNDDFIFTDFGISRKLLAVEVWGLHQTTQNLWFSICPPYIILLYVH